MNVKFTPNKKAILILTIIILIVVIVLATNQEKTKELTMKAVNYIKEKTWDIVTDRRINTLHPLVREKAKIFILKAEKELGIKLRVVQALRSWQEQADLYNKGRTEESKAKKEKIVTNAKAGDSYHNYGLAIDVVEIKDGKALWTNPNWSKIARLGKSLGFEWGGDWKSFKDKPHFQFTFGRKIADLKKLYQSGQKDGEYVRLAA